MLQIYGVNLRERYAVMQFPGQAGVTKGFRRGGEGGAAAEALRFCAGFVDDCFTPGTVGCYSQPR